MSKSKAKSKLQLKRLVYSKLHHAYLAYVRKDSIVYFSGYNQVVSTFCCPMDVVDAIAKKETERNFLDVGYVDIRTRRAHPNLPRGYYIAEKLTFMMAASERGMYVRDRIVIARWEYPKRFDHKWDLLRGLTDEEREQARQEGIEEQAKLPGIPADVLAAFHNMIHK